MEQLDLFGETVDQFTAAKARYGVWPITVWPCDHQDKYMQALKLAIGDDPNAAGDVKSRSGGKAHYTSQSGGPDKARHGSRGPNSGSGQFPGSPQASRANGNAGQIPTKISRQGTMPNLPSSGGNNRNSEYETHTSVFNPAVAAWLLNCYAPETGLCLDPFAGGGTRAIMACKHGLEYVGLEIRPEEVAAVQWRCQNQGIGPTAARIIQADARDCGDYGPADFLLTCPPYYDLEMYEGGPDDLSMAKTYNQFLDGIQDVVNGSFKALRPRAISCWVVGLHRDSRGNILPLHHDIASIHRRSGFAMKEEIILHQVNNGAIQRVGNFEKGQRHLIRVHEYALIFERLPNWRP